MDERQAQILEILDENYGEIGSGLNFHTPFELLVATILSAQSTDVRVNMVTPGLFAKYPTAFEMSQVSEEALAQDINSIGLYRNKSKSIIKASKNARGEIPRRGASGTREAAGAAGRWPQNGERGALQRFSYSGVRCGHPRFPRDAAARFCQAQNSGRRGAAADGDDPGRTLVQRPPSFHLARAKNLQGTAPVV